MAKKPVVAAEKIDPTLPFTEIVLDGTPYKMCFDLGAIGAAEAELEKTDPDVSLIECSWKLTKIRYLVVLFAASLRVYHPEISFAEAKALVNWKNANLVIAKIRIAQGLFAPEPQEDDAKASGPQDAPAES